MTSEQRNQMELMTRRPLGSIWGYWPFVFPVVLVVVGVAIQIALLGYFKSNYGDFDILIRHGKDVRLLWDSELVKEAVLTVSFSVTVTFGLLALLAFRSHKQAALLNAAARDLGIAGGQSCASPDGGPAAPLGNSGASAGRHR